MKAYSQDLRQRILQTVDEGKTQAQAASLFKVSETTVKRYVRQRREKGHVRPKPIPGRPPTKRAPLEAQLQPQLEKQPDATRAASIVTRGKRKRGSRSAFPR